MNFYYYFSCYGAGTTIQKATGSSTVGFSRTNGTDGEINMYALPISHNVRSLLLLLSSR
jgi:hypothetical protein